MIPIKRPDCMTCKYFNYIALNGFTCKAFPNGIPDDIIFTEIKHDKVLKNQVGEFIYEPIMNNGNN
jgi:hypothetical protein